MDINLDDLFDQIKKDKNTSHNVNSKVLIVDGLNNYLRSFSVNPAMNDDGTHIGGIVGFLYTTALAIRQHNPTRCIIVFDGRGGSTRRRKIYPDYKAQRKGLRVRLNRTYDFNTADEEHKEAMRQLIRISEYLDLLPITTLMVNNVEADDVIAYLVTEVFKEKSIIMSTDKDFLQLVNENVSIWSPIKKQLYTPEKVKEEYKIIPHNMVLFRMIDGDKSDNIPGVKNIGMKTLEKHLPILFKDKPIEYNDLLKFAETQLIKSAPVKRIVENKDILDRNFKLMRLDIVDISGLIKAKIRELIDKPISLIDKYNIKKIFLEDKLYSAIPNLDSWLNINFSKLQAYALSTHKKGEVS